MNLNDFLQIHKNLMIFYKRASPILNDIYRNKYDIDVGVQAAPALAQQFCVPRRVPRRDLLARLWSEFIKYFEFPIEFCFSGWVY